MSHSIISIMIFFFLPFQRAWLFNDDSFCDVNKKCPQLDAFQ